VPPTGSARTLPNFRAAASRLVVLARSDGIRMAAALSACTLRRSPDSRPNALDQRLADRRLARRAPLRQTAQNTKNSGSCEGNGSKRLLKSRCGLGAHPDS